MPETMKRLKHELAGEQALARLSTETPYMKRTKRSFETFHPY